ncbi:MAG: AP endonuclease [Rickettsiales bacterium]|nr:AP endonuclease [Rickettsiales bacterium]|tara:strand:+ start:14688 stop:15602 length:915 start_codon:yes stop_codon:yes gene_type:complete
MQLGLVSAILPDLSLEEVFETASEFGYDCIELMCWPVGAADRRYAGVTHFDATNITDQSIAELSALTEKHGVTVSGLGYYPNALSPDRNIAATAVEHIRRVIEATAAIGLTSMNTFVGRDWTKSIDENWPRFADTWGPLIELAEQHAVRIGIENCPMLFTNDEWPGGKNMAHSPAIWRRMFELFPSSAFGLNYDPSHMIWQQMDHLNPLHEFTDRIHHVHAKDLKIDTDTLNNVGILATPLAYHAPKLPGLGEIDWREFVTELKSIGYSGPVCIEVEDRDFEDTLENRRQALKQSAQYLRECGL